MATTTGLVQRLSIVTPSLTCVWIGPTPDNSEILLVQNDGTDSEVAFANSLIQMLSSASTNYRQVAAIHGDSDATITSVRLDPA